MKYGFIRKHADRYPVNLLCQMLSVHRSAYYDWRGSPCKVIEPEELALRRRMKKLFAASRESLGRRTMMENLRAEGVEIGRERTRTLMKALNLKVNIKRKYKVTTGSKHHFPVAENILNRHFYPQAPNQVWGTDITYLWSQEGWIYLAVVIDLYSRRVVGWAMDKRMKKALVIRALMMAVNLRQPPPGLLHHSDRGSQYASQAYQKLLKQYGMIASMSRKGNCWEREAYPAGYNAPIERFFSSLKREWIGDQLYRTRQEAIADVREYVAMYYNSRRLHSTLGYKTPMDYENTLNKMSGIS